METSAIEGSSSMRPSEPPGDNNQNENEKENDKSPSIATVNKNLDRCVLCLGDKRVPRSLPCGHTFCQECLNAYRSYRKYPWARRCPLCRTQLRDRQRGTKRRSTTNHTPPPSSRQNLNDLPSSTSGLDLRTNRHEENEEIPIIDLTESSDSTLNLYINNNDNYQGLTVNILPGISIEPISSTDSNGFNAVFSNGGTMTRTEFAFQGNGTGPHNLIARNQSTAMISRDGTTVLTPQYLDTNLILYYDNTNSTIYMRNNNPYIDYYLLNSYIDNNVLHAFIEERTRNMVNVPYASATVTSASESDNVERRVRQENADRGSNGNTVLSTILDSFSDTRGSSVLQEADRDIDDRYISSSAIDRNCDDPRQGAARATLPRSVDSFSRNNSTYIHYVIQITTLGDYDNSASNNFNEESNTSVLGNAQSSENNETIGVQTTNNETVFDETYEDSYVTNSNSGARTTLNLTIDNNQVILEIIDLDSQSSE